MAQPKKKTILTRKTKTNPSENLRERVLDDAATLKVPLSAEMLNAALARAEQEGLSHLNFLELIFGEPAARSRQRAIERRIREAKFRDDKRLTDFDWKFNGQAIDHAQIEQLATGEFLRRHENLVMVGQSGVGKSHLLQALGRRYCELGYRVRYTTSADLLEDLRASMADQTLPRRIGYWSRFDLVIIDEFGFDRIERGECPQAANVADSQKAAHRLRNASSQTQHVVLEFLDFLLVELFTEVFDVVFPGFDQWRARPLVHPIFEHWVAAILRLDARGLGSRNDGFALLLLDLPVCPGDRNQWDDRYRCHCFRLDLQIDEAIQHRLIMDAGDLGQLCATIHLLHAFTKGAPELLVLLVEECVDQCCLVITKITRHCHLALVGLCGRIYSPSSLPKIKQVS